MKRKLQSMLALLLTAVSGAWAQTDTPLTLEATTAGTIMVSSPQSGMQYTQNGGAKTAVTADAINVAVGDKVAFYGSGTSITSYSGTKITGGTAECYIYGNIMSLVDETGFATATTLTGDRVFYDLFNGNTKIKNHESNKLVLPAETLAEGCYSYMFFGCTSLTSAPELAATTLAEGCYQYMFQGCTSLTSAPELPATTLAEGCYESMFSDCTSLTAAPALPATTLAESCYSVMFSGCTSLTAAPALPATSLAQSCYQYMFQGCTNLTSAPELPATTLAQSCYTNMFQNCTSLTMAPELPATTLAQSCYSYMFNGCTRLNSVTCLATNISATNATANWLNGVAVTGTFTKNKDMTGWSTDTSGIPSGWTIVNDGVIPLTDGDNVATALESYAGQTIGVTYTRTFTSGKASTVCLPFAYTKKTGDGSFYAFSGITKEGDEYVATMTEPGTETLTANTPYLYMPSATGDVSFSGTYAIPSELTAGTTTSGDWSFVGTYSTIEWTTVPTGTYGFSAQDANDGITQGQFVKVGEYVRIKPMRAYLKYKNGAEDYAAAARALSPRRAAETLPETISVRLVAANGDVTAIGTLNTRTGEATTDGWYTLDGKRLNAQPTRKGIYVNNGKKVIIK